MKNSLKLLSVVLSLTAGAWCQNITASGSTCATSNACVSSQVTQAQGGATITLAGTFTATVQFEASVDGVTWKAIPSTDATPVTSATGAGVWQFNVAAYTTIRARCSAFTSGPIVVTINTSTASARSGGGSGGGGGVSSVSATSPVLSSGGSTPTISISGVTALQGNAAKLQLATGTTTTGHFPSYDASGNLIDSTQPTGASAGTTNDVQIAGAGGTFAADTGIFTYSPSTHILNAGQGITTGTGSGVATTLGLSGGTTPASFPTNAFGWLGPSSATFTSYFFQCPTTPPTNGQTIVFGTQVGSVVPCTYGTAGAVSSVFGRTGAVVAAANDYNFNQLAGNIATSQMNSGTGASSSTFWRGDGTWVAPTGGGNHNIDLMAGAAQLTAGCSINNSFLTNTAPTCLFQAGSATVPQQAFPQFTVAGTLGTTVTNGTALYIGPKTMPSDYTASGNLTIHFAVATPIAAVGAATFSVRYAHVTPPGTAQPTFVTTDYSTASLTLSGTNSTVTGIATITAPSLSAGDQVWFVVYLSAKTATDNPYLTQLYMSY